MLETIVEANGVRHAKNMSYLAQLKIKVLEQIINSDGDTGELTEYLEKINTYLEERKDFSTPEGRRFYTTRLFPHQLKNEIGLPPEV